MTKFIIPYNEREKKREQYTEHTEKIVIGSCALSATTITSMLTIILMTQSGTGLGNTTKEVLLDIIILIVSTGVFGSCIFVALYFITNFLTYFFDFTKFKITALICILISAMFTILYFIFQ